MITDSAVHDCCACDHWDPRDREHDDEGPCPELGLITKRMGGGCRAHFVPLPERKPTRERESTP